jgi:hypothetical protein
MEQKTTTPPPAAAAAPATKPAVTPAAAATAAPVAAPAAPVMPIEQATELVKAMERLLEKIDRERDESSLVALKLILDQHGDALKQFMRPENALHPDISRYNPEGERDHPRPALKRPAYFLGSPLELANLNRAEIDLLNRFDHTIETSVKGKLWKAAILRDMGGAEVLYLSVPFRAFDDLRGLPGLTDICETILNEGHRPRSQDLMNEQIQLQRSQIEELKAAIADLQGQQSAQVVTGLPV